MPGLDLSIANQRYDVRQGSKDILLTCLSTLDETTFLVEWFCYVKLN